MILEIRKHPVLGAALVLLLGAAVFVFVTHVKIDQFRYGASPECQVRGAKMTESRALAVWDVALPERQPAVVADSGWRRAPDPIDPLLPAIFSRQCPFAFRPPPSL